MPFDELGNPIEDDFNNMDETGNEEAGDLDDDQDENVDSVDPEELAESEEPKTSVKTKPKKATGKKVAKTATPKKNVKEAAKPAKVKAEPEPKPAVRTAPTNGKALVSEKEIGRSKQIAKNFKVLGDPTRVSIILILSKGETNVGAIADNLNQSQPATSHHLALLRHGGFVDCQRAGKHIYYNLTETGEKLSEIVKS